MAKKVADVPVVTEGSAPIFSADFGALAIDAGGAKLWFFNALRNPLSGMAHNDPAVIITMTVQQLDLYIADLMRVRAMSLFNHHGNGDDRRTEQEAEH